MRGRGNEGKKEGGRRDERERATEGELLVMARDLGGKPVSSGAGRIAAYT